MVNGCRLCGFGVDTGELVRLWFVGDVFVQRAVGLLLAAEELEVGVGDCDGTCREEENAAGFQALAPFASISARRLANSASSMRTWIERPGISISIKSPSSMRPIAPPSAASGETWPIERPEVPPEKRPSVTSAHALPRPRDFR